jgi:hypothetical protein
MDEYMVRLTPAHLPEDISIPICGLCGNSGRINMPVPYTNLRESHPLVRLEAFCLCDNGRALRRQERRRERAST